MPSDLMIGVIITKSNMLVGDIIPLRILGGLEEINSGSNHFHPYMIQHFDDGLGELSATKDWIR